MIDLILSGVKTPERSQSPENAYITEEEIFNELNPQVCFLFLIIKLKYKLYNFKFVSSFMITKAFQSSKSCILNLMNMVFGIYQ